MSSKTYVAKNPGRHLPGAIGYKVVVTAEQVGAPTITPYYKLGDHQDWISLSQITGREHIPALLDAVKRGDFYEEIQAPQAPMQPENASDFDVLLNHMQSCIDVVDEAFEHSRVSRRLLARSALLLKGLQTRAKRMQAAGFDPLLQRENKLLRDYANKLIDDIAAQKEVIAGMREKRTKDEDE